ncbi:MAG: hypothetical protein HYR51_01995 [Candidatus Rokubacteria bacterium]|nr:hypothetical protein [Candidatus Rokubacteria bacterium]
MLSGPAVVAAEDIDAFGELSARVYERGADGAIRGRRLPDSVATATPAAGIPLHDVAEPELKASLAAAAAARAAALQDLPRAPAASPLVPEDLSRRPRVMHMAVINYTDATLVEYVARVGQLEGFSVVARVAPSSSWLDNLAHIPGLRTVRVAGVEYIWSEDILEIGLDGSFRMTARYGDRGLLRRAQFVDRIRRYGPKITTAELDAIRRMPDREGEPPGDLPVELLRNFPETMFMIQGLVETDRGQEAAAAVAAARRADMREATTYLEGGNVLVGRLPGGEPYALVGRDSAAVSRALLERHAGRALDEADVVAAMARDLGVAPNRLYLVEQPGVFHLDMALTLLRPGTVVMNDAFEAFKLQSHWLREDYEAWRPRRETFASGAAYAKEYAAWREAGDDLDRTIGRLWKYAERFARGEARALADLEAAGLRVLRLPGRFLHTARPWDRDVMNFLNGEAGTSARGGTFFMTQGGDPRAERLIARLLLAPETGLDRVYFAPRLASRDTLWEKGAVGCRVKVEGDVVSNPTR